MPTNQPVILTKPSHLRTENGRVVVDLPSLALPLYRVEPEGWTDWAPQSGLHSACHLVTTNLDGTNWEYWCLVHDGGTDRPDNDCTGHPLWR